MEIGILEFRADSWDNAAKGIIDLIKTNDVRRGQVLSIDAHNNSPNDQAIFSAI